MSKKGEPERRTISIHCARCRELLYRYKKGGTGGLVKCFVERIVEDTTDGDMKCAQCGQEFAYCNVLADPEIFQNLPRYADWPTFPQVYINGELIGGCDITLEMFDNGDLKKMIDEAHTG